MAGTPLTRAGATSSDAEVLASSKIWTVIFASSVGTMIEWYDFYIFGSLTSTLLQNIEVLSAGQDFKKDTEGKPVSVQAVNLLVTPEQAEKLSLAANQTTIQLVLRNPLDTQVAKTSGTALSLLFGRGALAAEDAAPKPRPVGPAPPAKPVPAAHAAPPTAAAQPAPAVVIETINGAKRAETKFQEKAQ